MERHAYVLVMVGELTMCLFSVPPWEQKDAASLIGIWFFLVLIKVHVLGYFLSLLQS